MTAADAFLAAFSAVAVCLGVAALAPFFWPDHSPFRDTVPDMAPPPRNSDRRDAADELDEA